jgi:dihydroflavonol-4-reductase
MAQGDTKDKTALVTGATGFIGENLVNALLRKGYSVTCLVRSTSDTRSLQKLPVRLVVGSLENPDPLRKEIQGLRVVFHIAGLTKAPNREQFFRTNQTGTLRLLEILTGIDSGSFRFVHVSSLAAAGPSEVGRSLTEKDDSNPVSWYGESKLESEMEVLKYANAFPVTILRPSAVYGPGDRDIYLIFRMIRRGCLFSPGRFNRYFNLIHVDDLNDALIKAGELDTPSGEIFYISHPEIHTWEAVGRVIAEELGTRYHQVSLPQWLALAAGLAGTIWSLLSGRTVALNIQKVRELLQPSWTCDMSKAHDVLGFNPVIDLRTGVRKTIHWYRQQGWL